MRSLVAIARNRWMPLLAPPALLAFLAVKPTGAGPTVCPFAIATGHACPLCGGTRAASALVQGDLTAAWALHPMIFAIAPLALFGWVAWLGVSRGWWNAPSSKLTNRFALVVGIGTFSLWIARAISGTLPPV